MSRVDELLELIDDASWGGPNADDALFELAEMARKSEPKHADTVVWELPT